MKQLAVPTTQHDGDYFDDSIFSDRTAKEEDRPPAEKQSLQDHCCSAIPAKNSKVRREAPESQRLDLLYPERQWLASVLAQSSDLALIECHRAAERASDC